MGATSEVFRPKRKLNAVRDAAYPVLAADLPEWPLRGMPEPHVFTEFLAFADPNGRCISLIPR
jgi:hypothetical protein